MSSQQYIPYVNQLSLKNKIGRLLWRITWIFLFRPFGTNIFRYWRLIILKLFGAKIDWDANVYASVRIWAPWNLTVKSGTCIAANVHIHNVSMVTIFTHSTISEGAWICTPSHDIYSHNHEMISKPVTIGAEAWVAVQAFVGMGVTVGEGAVVGARAVVYKDVAPWDIVGGNPAKVIGHREFRK